MITRSLRTVATALIICIALNGCAAFSGEGNQLHQVSMMVPNTPGGGYDIAALSCLITSWAHDLMTSETRCLTTSETLLPTGWRR